MASNQTFQKRQKEQARKERRNAKAERKAQRKLEKESARANGQPESHDVHGGGTAQVESGENAGQDGGSSPELQ